MKGRKGGKGGRALGEYSGREREAEAKIGTVSVFRSIQFR